MKSTSSSLLVTKNQNPAPRSFLGKITHSVLSLFLGMGAAFSLHSAETPEIARIQGYTGSAPVTIWGVGFECEEIEVIGWAAEFDEEKARAALAETDFDAKSLLPAEPPEDARRLNMHAADENGLTMVASLGRNAEEVIWVRNSAGVSAPSITAVAQPWFAFPESAAPGDRIRIFGRYLRHRYRPNLFAVRSVEDGSVTKLADGITVRNEAYEIDTRLPADLKPGSYDIHINNSFGGSAGWSKGVRIEVIAPVDSPKVTVLNARDFGAKGDGATDDTEAIRKALAAAAGEENGMVSLPAGRYVISGTLEIPEGVSLEGDGMAATTLQVLERNPMKNDFPEPESHETYAVDWIKWWENLGHNAAPMVWLRNRSAVRDLNLVPETNSGAMIAVLVARAPGIAEDIRIERIGFTIDQPTTSHESAVRLMGFTRNLVIRGNTFLGGDVVANANWHVQPYIGHNMIRATQYGVQPWNAMFLRGVQRGIVENNEIIGSHRNFVMQRGPRWSPHEDAVEGERLMVGLTYHVAFMGNVLRDVVARRHNAGETMIEHGSGDSAHRLVKEAAADRVVLEGEELAPNQTGFNVLVLTGRGVGQYRRVAEHQPGNVLLLEEPWDVIPDSKTFVQVAPFAVEHLWIDNTEENIAGWTGFWGPNLGHVIDGHILRNGGGLYLWPYDEKTTVAFVEMRQNWLSFKGRFVFRGRGLAFGNSILRGNEVTDFSFRPNQHGTIRWAHVHDNRVIEARDVLVNRAGVAIEGDDLPEEMPDDVPFRSWNMIDRTLIHNGPIGISIPEKARYTVLHRNVITEVRDPIIDKGQNTVFIDRQFTDKEEE